MWLELGEQVACHSPEVPALSTVPIIDAHHHVWRLADLPWLSGPPVPRIFGEYDAIRRDYSIEECLAGGCANPLKNPEVVEGYLGVY